MINEGRINKFLEGKSPKQYIVSIETSYGNNDAMLIINDPVRGKYVAKEKYHSFIWFKEEITKFMFDGKRSEIGKATKKYGVVITKLKTGNEKGEHPDRLMNGYKYMAKVNGSYSKLLNFFREGGIEVYNEKFKRYFMAISPSEQYMIGSGKRLFKGFDDYNDLHRFQFDLETTGLHPKGNFITRGDVEDIKKRQADPNDTEDLTKLYEFNDNNEPLRHKDAEIFQIGVKDNKGYEEILESGGNTKEERKRHEIYMILRFFQIIDELGPDIIAGYNSEHFDWPFFFTRCEILGIDIEVAAKTLDKSGRNVIKRVEKSIKLGGEREDFKQTTMWGFNIIDVSHSVRKAKAINSNIKKWNLKYITQYSNLNKKNRVYVEGDKIFKTWADKETKIAFNDTDGDWYPITPEKPLKDGYEEVLGKSIIRRYLLDDLFETEAVDGVFNQASFLLGKIIPTTYMRSSTMGTAGIWKLIMAAWSYENRLAIPDIMPQKTFTGGLSRLLEVGYAKNVAKLDYAALYPNIQLTGDIFPNLDISGVMKGLLLYIANNRDKFKGLMNENKTNVKLAKNYLLTKGDTITEERKQYVKEKQEEFSLLADMFDKKQLPIKILGNSFFGSLGAPNIFNWGDTDSAEQITCTGRQYLRLMVYFFVKRGFRPLVGDSVTFDTPIYIKWKDDGEIDILPICDIYNENFDNVGEEGLRDYEIKPYEVLTVNGWKEINYVYRHKTNKKIHRVSTKDKLVCVTEDHSLFQHGNQIKPSELKRGDFLDVRDVPKLKSNDDSEFIDDDLYFLYGYFLGDGSSFYGNRKQYYISKKTGKKHINKGKRSVFKISGTNLEKLEKLQKILSQKFLIDSNIKDHRKSSGVYNLISHRKELSTEFSEEFYTSYRDKKVPRFVLNTNDENKLSFLNGVFSSDGYGDDLESVSDIGMKSQIAMSGIGYLMDNLKIDKKIKTRKDKENFISFRLKNRNRDNSSFTNKTKMKSDEVWLNEIIENKDTNNYVYDISTEDGTFIGGIGGVDLKNTDGFNFAIPDNIDEYKFTPKGTHRFTEEDKDKELSGLLAVVAEFNEKFMIGRMGLDIDDICETTINFSRKNYGNLIGGKVKLVGNTIKSSKMPIYIEEFLDEGIKYLLDGDGHSFVQLYNATVDKIYNFQIPLRKIASKANVKQTINQYLADMKTKTKAGNFKAKKAYMELLIRDGITPNLGETIYYVNTGTVKSHGDCKVVTDKETGKRVAELKCKLISTKDIENNSELTTDEYNVPKYLDAFNKRIHPLLVCFDSEIRDKIVTNMVRNKKTKEMELTTISAFTRKECKLTSGVPFKDGDQDTMKELMTMEDKEIEFWIRVGKLPNNLEDMGMDWEVIQKDYHERKRIEKLEGILFDKKKLIEVVKRLEVKDLENFFETKELPDSMNPFLEMKIGQDIEGNDAIFISSTRWGTNLVPISFIKKYQTWANERSIFYTSVDDIKKHTYENWLESLLVEAITNEDVKKINFIKGELNIEDIDKFIEKSVKV